MHGKIQIGPPIHEATHDILPPLPDVGGAGSGTVTSIDAVAPITVTPAPIIGTGTITHDDSGVTAATYGDAGNVPQLTVSVKGHVTAATTVPIGAVAAVGAYLTIIGEIEAAQDSADEALGMVGATIPQTIVTGGVVWATMVGGGGGGSTGFAAGTPGWGGGSGESCEGFMIRLTPGSSIAYSIGAGGGTDTDGGDTTFGPLTAKGGKKGVTGSSGPSGAGGGAGGGGGLVAAGTTQGNIGIGESATYFGGSSGGARGSGTGGNGGPGGGSGGYAQGGPGGTAGGGNGGGGGGAASIYGAGGAGGSAGAAGSSASATSYGAGGGGGSGTAAGGSGAGGYLFIAWLGGSLEVTSGSGTWTVPI